MTCRHLESGITNPALLARMMGREASCFISEVHWWDQTPEAVRSCSMIANGCPQALYTHVGFLHQIPPARAARIDYADSHTPFSDNLASVGQDNRFRLQTLDELLQHMIGYQQYAQPYNEVCARVNRQTVVGLLCSTAHSRNGYEVSTGQQAYSFLVQLKHAHGVFASLPIFAWDARNGRLFQPTSLADL